MLPHGGTGIRTFREVSALGRELASVPGIVGTRCTADVALVMDWNSWWALELDSHPSTALDQVEIALAHYRPLFEGGICRDYRSRAGRHRFRRSTGVRRTRFDRRGGAGVVPCADAVTRLWQEMGLSGLRVHLDVSRRPPRIALGDRRAIRTPPTRNDPGEGASAPSAAGAPRQASTLGAESANLTERLVCFMA